MRVLILLSGIFLGIVGLLFLTRPEIQADLREIPPQVVDTIIVTQQDVRHAREISGKLQPSRTANLRFQVAGSLTKRWVEPGQQVGAGQVLLEVDPGDYADAATEKRALLEQENKAIERDRALLELEEQEAALLQRELERLARLERESLVSMSHYEEIEQKLIRSQAEIARLSNSVATAGARQRQKGAALQRAQRDLDRTRLTAPFAATVNRVLLETGDYATPGQHAVDLVQVEELDIYLEAPGDLAEYLAPDQLVDVRINGGHIQGRIIALALDPDPATNTHPLRVRIDGAGLYPGKIVSVTLPGRFFSQARIIPVTAVLNERDADYVFVVERNRLRKHPVRLIARHGAAQVIDGIEAGTTLVAYGVAAYSDGQRVSIRK
ncbi:MAG: efflux RND transporter periplasmic adaptor subunit [Gammaproteobacteria bacterium]|nr:efflux RND transporter periplasmic adaptor subunit [Gammaproteobacteria bacterium]MDE0286319.1 efflux RND transporter periplasmic adaptor subunit [Gammaproteobacteria bacterium]MDE0511708.1 efflux RND transporter periplasmic adaptor subunit [Gammaproteobacteria bacterium]